MRLFEGTPFDIPPKCDDCGELEEDCKCPPKPPERIAPEKQTAKIRVEKRKKGKIVTVVRGLAVEDLPELLTKLKNSCGAGGTIKDEAIEIQGDHPDRVDQVLSQIGYRTKR